MKKELEYKCVGCAWWCDSKSGSFKFVREKYYSGTVEYVVHDCRRFPPQIFGLVGDRSRFSEVTSDNGCGEWKPYTDEQPFIASTSEINIILAHRKMV